MLVVDASHYRDILFMVVTRVTGVHNRIIDGHKLSIPVEVVVETICCWVHVRVITGGDHTLQVIRHQAVGLVPLAGGLQTLRSVGIGQNLILHFYQESPIFALPTEKLKENLMTTAC